MSLVEGIGINNKIYPTTNGGKPIRSYTLWVAILRRCANKQELERNPSYLNTIINSEILSYSSFHEFIITQTGYSNKSFELDKDLLSSKNKKVYSFDTIVFIPHIINCALTTSKKSRGDLPIGVSLSKGRHQARCKLYGKDKFLGMFDTKELAFAKYKQVKEEYLKELANLYKDEIDIRAYNALMTYSVDIGD